MPSSRSDILWRLGRARSSDIRQFLLSGFNPILGDKTVIFNTKVNIQIDLALF